MTRYDTTGNGGITGAGCPDGEGGMATIAAPMPAGIGDQTCTPANTIGMGGCFGGDNEASTGLAAAFIATIGAAPDQVEKTCWRYAKPSAGSAE
jgi:hypothetical protein